MRRFCFLYLWRRRLLQWLFRGWMEALISDRRFADWRNEEQRRGLLAFSAADQSAEKIVVVVVVVDVVRCCWSILHLHRRLFIILMVSGTKQARAICLSRFFVLSLLLWFFEISFDNFRRLSSVWVKKEKLFFIQFCKRRNFSEPILEYYFLCAWEADELTNELANLRWHLRRHKRLVGNFLIRLIFSFRYRQWQCINQICLQLVELLLLLLLFSPHSSRWWWRCSQFFK